MKKVLLNIWYWLKINLYIGIGHIWALIGIAFNDTGEHYDTVFEAIPYLNNGLSFLIVLSIIAGILNRKNEKFSLIQYIIMQGIMVLAWVMFYISNLVG